MWQAVKIFDQNYFFQCSIEDSKVTYHLYDLKEIWSEECSVSDVLQRAKQLNKRISYNDEIVLKTVEECLPTTMYLQESVDDAQNLLIKYHISGRPFNFQWELKLLPQDKFQKIVTYPLFASIYYFSEQIKELKDAIKKKDLEIAQYKAEGAVLRRTTVATVPFDEDVFNHRYESANKMGNSFLDVALQIKSSLPQIEIKKAVAEAKDQSQISSAVKLKKSPMKSKRRKFFENRRLHLEHLHKAKGKSIEFESSQSQTPPIDVPVNDAPNDELAEIFHSLDELNAKRMQSNTL